MICTERLLITLKRPLVQLLGLGQLALVRVEGPQVIDCIERQRVIYTERLLVEIGRAHV